MIGASYFKIIIENITIFSIQVFTSYEVYIREQSCHIIELKMK